MINFRLFLLFVTAFIIFNLVIHRAVGSIFHIQWNNTYSILSGVLYTMSSVLVLMLYSIVLYGCVKILL